MSAVTAAQGTLPSWVVWGNVLFYPGLAFLLTLAAASLAVRLASFPRRRMMAASTWTEQARQTFPACVAAVFVARVAPFLCCALAFLYTGPLNRIPFGLLALLAGLSSYGAATFVRWRLAMRMERAKTTSRQWLRGVLGDNLLFFPERLVVFPLLALLPDHVDGFFVTLLLLGLVLMGLFACGGGLSLARAVGLARLIDERLRLIVERAAARTGMQPRGCYRIASTLTNAIVFPLSKRLVFTEALTTVLNENELEAVCAHEMAHLQEPLLVDLARLALLPLLLAFSAFRMILAAGGLIALDVLLLGYVLVALLLGRLSWRMEQRADRIATGHESEAGVYARALEKIHAADLMPAVVAGRSSTHPHLYDRLLAAGVQPSYERPRPPSQWRIVSARALAILLLGVGLLFLPVTRDFLFRQSESALLVSLALGGDAKELSLLAYHYQLRGDKGGVATLYRARGELERLSLSRPAILP